MQLQFCKNTQIVAQTWRFKNGSKKTITSKTQKEKKKKDQERHGRHGIKKEERRKDKGYERIHNLRAYEIFRKADCSLKLAQLALRFRHIKTTTTGQVNDAPERSGHSSKDLDSALPSKTPSESWFIWCYEMLRVDSSRFSRFRLRLQQACKRQNCCANPLSGLDWRLLVKRYDRCDCVLQVNRLCKLRRCCHKDVSKRRKLKQIMCQRGDCAIACLKHRHKLPPSTDSILGGPEHICLARAEQTKSRHTALHVFMFSKHDSFIWNSLRKHGKWSKVTKFEEWRWLSAKYGQTMINRELWSLMLEANFVQAGAGSSQWHTVMQD